MTHGSLFSGIGGFDLAAEWMGWKNAFHCEWNEFGQRVLKHYWPKAVSYGDITKTDFSRWYGTVDVISGGFPCQPYSSAGKRLGKEDERHLWPEMLRAIREVSPRWVVGENVRGLVNWNDGLVFNEVQTDLEAEGYEVQPYLLPACGVNAPHRRDRVWFVAYGKSNGSTKQHALTKAGEQIQTGGHSNRQNAKGTTPNTENIRCNEAEEFKREWRECQPHHREKVRCASYTNGSIWTTSNTERLRSSGEEHGKEESRQHTQAHPRGGWADFPTEPPVCGGDDGLSTGLDGITFPKWRNESIKAYGNAVVPQVVHQIFKAIEEYETTTSRPINGLPPT